jgi:hypothetical protein
LIALRQIAQARHLLRRDADALTFTLSHMRAEFLNRAPHRWGQGAALGA